LFWFWFNCVWRGKTGLPLHLAGAVEVETRENGKGWQHFFLEKYGHYALKVEKALIFAIF